MSPATSNYQCNINHSNFDSPASSSISFITAVCLTQGAISNSLLYTQDISRGCTIHARVVIICVITAAILTYWLISHGDKACMHVIFTGGPIFV